MPVGAKEFKKRGDIDQLVQNIDYAPTILDFAGVEVPKEMQGESMLPLLKGGSVKDWRQSIYYHYFEYPAEHAVRRHYGVRDSRYKLIHFYGHDIDNWELYDLQNDPSEMNNIYDNPTQTKVRERMHKELERLRAKYEDK